MGGSLSATGENLKPIAMLGDVPDNFVCAACNDTIALILTDSKQVEVRAFSGEITTKQLNLRPSAVCALRSGGWVIGFENGFLSEFTDALTLVRSYRVPGAPSAHAKAIKSVVHINRDEGGSAHIMSLDLDNVLRFWGNNGELLHTLTPRVPLVRIACSPYFAFLVDEQKNVNVLDLERFAMTSYPVISNAKAITTIGDGFAALAVLENHSVLLLGPKGVVETFKFTEADMMTSVLPLIVEEGTGLITYVTVDMQGKMVLRALELITGELGEGYKLITDSYSHLIVSHDGHFAVFKRDDLVKMSVDVLPEMSLPREKIARALERV